MKNQNPCPNHAVPRDSDPAEPNELLQDASACNHSGAQTELINQVCRILWAPAGLSDEDKGRRVELAMIILRRLAPRTEIEGMLAGQMIATHAAAMDCLHHAMTPTSSHAQDRHMQHAIKLLSVHARLVDSFKKLRTMDRRKLPADSEQVHSDGPVGVDDIGAEVPRMRPTLRERKQKAIAHDADKLSDVAGPAEEETLAKKIGS